MTIHQKAIRLIKECESRIICQGCPYYHDCKFSEILLLSPTEEDIEDVIKAIKKEKWNVE